MARSQSELFDIIKQIFHNLQIIEINMFIKTFYVSKNMMVIYVSRQTDKVNAIKKICSVEENAE